MFNDQITGLVNIPSNWKVKAKVKDDEAQTHGYKVISRANQIVRRADMETQTDDFLYVEEDIQLDYQEEDRREVARHLRRISPFLCSQLERNSRSRAFDHYDAYYSHYNRSRSTSKLVNLRHTLSQKECTELGLGVTTLSWNCSGTVVAVAYGDQCHENWCMHASCVALWNVMKQQINPNEPDYSFDTQSCVLSMQFHPTLPSLLVAGCFNGDIIVWDLSSTGGDFTIAQSNNVNVQGGSDSTYHGVSLLSFSHTEPVVSIQWLCTTGAQKMATRRLRYNQKLVSAGMDGKLLVWKLSPAPAKMSGAARGGPEESNIGSLSDILQVVYGYEIRASDLPRTLRIRGRREQALNLTCALLSPVDPDVVLVACDVGVIFHCSIREVHSGKLFDPNLPLSSPVEFTLTPSGDGAQSQGCSIHAMSWLQPSNKTSTKSVEGQTRSASSSSLLLLCAGANGVLNCLNPHEAGSTQVLFTVELPSSSSAGSSAYIYSVCSCDKQGLYAIGGESGDVWFWRSKEDIFTEAVTKTEKRPDAASQGKEEPLASESGAKKVDVKSLNQEGDIESMLPCMSLDWRGHAHHLTGDDDLEVQQSINDATGDGMKAPPSVWCTAGNNQNGLYFAIGYSNGKVQVWDMSQFSIES